MTDMMVLHNPTEAPIKDYPIQNPVTKEVLLWGIDSGQTLEFPQYVGKYLLEVYSFLQEVMTQDQYKARKEEEKQVSEGRVYSQVRIVNEAGEVVEATPVETAPVATPGAGFTNENMQPHNGVEDKPACPECKATFGNIKIMKKHFVEMHVEKSEAPTT